MTGTVHLDPSVEKPSVSPGKNLHPAEGTAGDFLFVKNSTFEDKEKSHRHKIKIKRIHRKQ